MWNDNLEDEASTIWSDCDELTLQPYITSWTDQHSKSIYSTHTKSTSTHTKSTSTRGCTENGSNSNISIKGIVILEDSNHESYDEIIQQNQSYHFRNAILSVYAVCTTVCSLVLAILYVRCRGETC